jgi:hypothetical protein
MIDEWAIELADKIGSYEWAIELADKIGSHAS